MPRLESGFIIPPLMLATLSGETLAVPGGGPELVHLQFRRFAGCPICNTHLRTFMKRSEDIKAAGVREIVFFHSSADDLRKHHTDLPFPAIPDPTKTHYRAFGVETSLSAALHPQALWAAAKSLLRGKVGVRMENGPMGLPADFLLSPTGKVLAFKYGVHAYDQWEVDDLLTLAAKARLVG